MSRADENYVKIFVGLMPKTVTEDEISSVFSRFGTIKEVFLMKEKGGSSKGCCFIRLASRVQADRAIAGANGSCLFPGQTTPCDVKLADGEETRLANLGISSGNADNKLFVGKIPVTMTDTELTSLFSEFGEVDRVWIMTHQDSGLPKGSAFVYMADADGADNAIQQLNGKRTLPGCSNPLKVDYAEMKPKASRPFALDFGNPPLLPNAGMSAAQTLLSKYTAAASPGLGSSTGSGFGSAGHHDSKYGAGFGGAGLGGMSSLRGLDSLGQDPLAGRLSALAALRAGSTGGNLGSLGGIGSAAGLLSAAQGYGLGGSMSSAGGSAGYGAAGGLGLSEFSGNTGLGMASELARIGLSSSGGFGSSSGSFSQDGGAGAYPSLASSLAAAGLGGDGGFGGLSGGLSGGIGGLSRSFGGGPPTAMGLGSSDSMAGEPETHKVYIAGLPTDIEKGQVWELFSKFGIVTDVFVMDKQKNPGCAFVRYTSYESAEKAIGQMSGKKVGANTLIVKHAFDKLKKSPLLANAPPDPVAQRAASNGFPSVAPGFPSGVQGLGSKMTPVPGVPKLFVSGFSDFVSEGQLHAVFEQCGPVQEIFLKRGPDGRQAGFAFVRFFTVEAALLALQGLNEQYTMPGSTRPLQIKIASGEPDITHPSGVTLASGEKRPSPDLDAPAEKLFVGGLPLQMGTNDLATFASRFGLVMDSYVMRADGLSRGCGFLRFQKKREAELFMNALNGKMLEGSARVLSVRYAKPTAGGGGEAQPQGEDESANKRLRTEAEEESS